MILYFQLLFLLPLSGLLFSLLQPLVQPFDNLTIDLINLVLMPNIVPHIDVKEYILVFLAEWALRKQFEGDHRVDQLVASSLDDEKGTFVVFEGLRAIVHCLG